MRLNFSLVQATALDCSGTACGYGETIDRSGVSKEDIGKAVLLACEKLIEAMQSEDNTGISEEDVGMVIVRFSHDT